MHIPKPSTLQTKFVFGLLVTSLIMGSAFSAGFYLHMRTVLEEEVRDKARLIFMHVDSIQQYVRGVLRPTMYERLPSSFIIQAMSTSYVSRTIMAPVNDDHAGTVYRRVAIDARNPAYEANVLEREMIKHFRAEPEEALWQGYKAIDGERYYLMVRPVRFEQGCMYCHGRPEDAPAELLNLYGDRGFGKQLGAIAGVDFVGISVHGSVGRLQQTILTFFAFFALGALLFFSLTNVLFRVLVVNNLKRLSGVFRRNVADDKGSDLLRQLEQGDELDELVEGMERMGEHLFIARRQLQDYAENLRKMVDDRTEALTREAEERQADVRLFVRLLEDMRKSGSRAELWGLALPQICRRFRARRLTYVCTMAPRNHYSWPIPDAPVDFPENFVDALTGSACTLSGCRIFVPVESSTGNAEGMLCLYWDTEEEALRQDQGVLLALGRQLGTAAENLTAIDSIMRQMTVLETIVEGISDPLALMDERCKMSTVNEAGRRLALELSDGTRTDGNFLSVLYDAATEVCPMAEAIARGKPELREVDFPGGRSFALSLYPVRAGKARSDRVVVYARETTMEKRMRMQVWHSERMATVGKLTAGLAHEINNPLGVILCYTGLLRHGLTAPEQLADVDVIERHTRQAQRVLRELLNFARPKTATSGVSDAVAVAASVVEVFAVQAAKKKVSLRLDCVLTSCLVALGTGEVEQVLSNLVINALDAVAADSGQVVASVREEGREGVVVVEDNGPGIPEDNAPHIFDPFYSTKDIGAGTGLGLTVVYGMVTDVGGSVYMDGSPMLGGARFTVRLPLAAQDRGEEGA